MNSSKVVIDEKFGPITSKNSNDRVVLVGSPPEQGSLFADNIELILYPEGTNKQITIPIPEFGYNMQLFLGNFTGNGLSEIMVRGDFGGTGSYTIASIFTYTQNQLQRIFNETLWSEQHPCTAMYLDHYQLQVTCSTVSNPVIIDLSSYPKDYLDSIYTSDKKVKPFQSASISYLNEVLPIKPVYQDYYNLLLSQRIVGIANADTLGYVQTRLNYQDDTFVPIMRGVLTGNLLKASPNTTRLSNQSTSDTFYPFAIQLLNHSSLPQNIVEGLTNQVNKLQDHAAKDGLTSSTFRKYEILKSSTSKAQRYRLLSNAIVNESKDYEHALHTTPYLAPYHLQRCSLLLCLHANLRSLHNTYRTEIYHGNQFNINKDNLDLIVNTITEDNSTLYVDAYLVNLTDKFLSEITDFNLSLHDASGKLFATKTFNSIDIGNRLIPFQGKRIYLPFYKNEYSLFKADTSNISWDYTYNYHSY